MIYADLHIHIGRSLDGKPVKITAASSLTLPNILHEARDVKGLSFIGLVDGHSIGVRRDFQALIAEGVLKLQAGGGYQANGLTVIPGSEVELDLGQGSAHLLAYFPDMDAVGRYTDRLKPYIKNWQLSSQKAYVSVEDWIEAVERVSGVWLPAHAFTPHKGIYGNCCRSMREVIPKMPLGLEIGLSADRHMALALSELDGVELFSNSDAHSLPKIAREYNALRLSDNSFEGLKLLLEKKSGRLIANYGLMPEVGKYHRTYCLVCEEVVEAPPPALFCPRCGSNKVVMGVLDRLVDIADRPVKVFPTDSSDRTTEASRYHYQIPLRQLPGVGPKTVEKLLGAFGTEMAILHEAFVEDIARVGGEKVARLIDLSRSGLLQVSAGGGGVFGRVMDILS